RWDLHGWFPEWLFEIQRHRGPCHSRAAILDSQESRLQCGRIQWRQNDGDSTARLWDKCEAAPAVQRQDVEPAGCMRNQQRFHLRRYRISEHVGRDALTTRRDRNSRGLHGWKCWSILYGRRYRVLGAVVRAAVSQP